MTAAVILAAATWAAAQQPQQKPCTTPEFRQFDFWVGEWNVSWEATPQQPAGTGTNRIERKLGDCVIQENFSGGPLQGMSVSTYSPVTKKWQQTWVDNFGSYLDFDGEFAEGKMILTREAVGPKGNKFHQRMVWFNIKADSLEWNWERSDDGGKTWKLMWHIRYQRAAGGSSEAR